MDGLDVADRDLLRAARLYACHDDLACRRLSRGRARRRGADTDHARRPPVRVADPRRGHSSALDRLHRHRRHRHAADRRGRLRGFEPLARNAGFTWLRRAGVSHGLKAGEEVRSGNNRGLSKCQSLQRRNNMRRFVRRNGPPMVSRVWASKILMMTSAVALMAASAAVSAPAFADEAAAKKWIDSEFQPSTLSKDDQMKEMQWFIKAAEPFKGMDINVV